MGAFFLTIVNMSISASWLVLAVLLLRLLLKKAPKWITVLLWGIVAVRLICPLSVESVLSLIPSTETINPDILVDSAPIIDSNFPVIDGVENPVIGENPVINGGDSPVVGDNPVIGEPSAPTPDASANPLQTVIAVSSVVWLVGIAGMLAYTVISYFRVKRKIGTAVRLQDNIFQSESVVSPFVLGLIKPKIYLPFGMDGQDMEYVIAHENAHIRRKDHWWKPVGFLILTLHWFNPLLWLSYVLLCRDIELACDEKVIKELDFQQKADYSQALLNCSVNRRIIAACPLAFGEVGVKERVKSVLKYKKPAFWIIVVAIVASIVAAGCFLTDPMDKNSDDTIQQTDSSDATENTEPTTPNKGETVKVAEPFASVLNSTKSFYFENEGKSVLLSDYYKSIWKLTSVDIDHDGNKEIAVMFGAEDGTLILWQHGGYVYGYEFSFRALYRINKDGTFLWNTNSGNTYGCSSIAFEGTKVKTTEVWRVEHNDGSFTNYIDNKLVSQEQMNAFAQYRDLEEVEWTVFGSNTTIVGTAEEWKESENPYAITDEFIAACNQTSGGYINYLNGKYYYRNTEGDKLFMCDADGKNAVCIDSCTSGETISSITASETAIYYSKFTRLDPVPVIPTGEIHYPIHFVRQIFQFCDGKVTALSEKNVLDYALSKDYIFYTTINSAFLAAKDPATDIPTNTTMDADADIKLYRMKHDGTEKTAIFDLGIPMDLNVSEDRVYAYGFEGFVLMEFDGKTSSDYHHQLYTYSPAVNQSTMYFVNTNGSYYLCKTKSSDESTASWLDNQQVVIADKVRAYTVYNGRFVYERISTDEILITDTNGANPKVICKGTNPISLNGHLFYLDENDAIKVADI